jgi:hypothetical protein
MLASMKYLALLLLLSNTAFGQASGSVKLKIKFVCTCDDSVGVRYATALRDLIAKSPRYVETNDFSEGTSRHLGIRVVSVDQDDDHTGRSTAMSIVFTSGSDVYLTHAVQTCGINRVESCAADTLADLDSLLHR